MINKLISWGSKLDLDRQDKILIAIGSFLISIILVAFFIEPPFVSEAVDAIVELVALIIVIPLMIREECRFKKIESEYKKIMEERRKYDK